MAKLSTLTIKFPLWSKFLEGDPDKEFLTEIFAPGGGFKIVGPNVKVPSSAVANYKSALDAWDIVDRDIKQELANGFIARVDFVPRKINAIGVVAKKNGKLRRITDLSRPKGKALNEFTHTVHFEFASIDDACRVIMLYKIVFGGKFDLVSAYRHIPIWPEHWDLLGFMWDGIYYIDLRLCFGLNTAPYVFWRISNFIVRVGNKYYNVVFIIPYMDDYLVLSPGNTREEAKDNCTCDCNNFTQCLSDMGWEISAEKFVAPCQDLVFLGIRINLADRVLSLPDDKLAALLSLLKEFSSRTSAIKRQIESLAGHLNFACKVVRGGRTFLHRIITLMNTVDDHNAEVELDDEFRLDVQWWLDFASEWNGKAVMLDPHPIDSRRFSVDASNRAVCAIFDNEFIIFEHDDITSSWHINDKECFGVFIAALRWGHLWQNCHIVVESDNSTTVAAINSGSCRSKNIMHMLRKLFGISARFNFHITAKHVPGILNTLADAGSRLNLTPLVEANLSMVPCPATENLQWN